MILRQSGAIEQRNDEPVFGFNLLALFSAIHGFRSTSDQDPGKKLGASDW